MSKHLYKLKSYYSESYYINGDQLPDFTDGILALAWRLSECPTEA